MSEHRGATLCPCGQELVPDPRVPILRTTCPRCGAESLVSGFVKMDVALSEMCNYRCKMCRRPPRPATLDTRDVIRVMEEASRIGVGTVSFCGGEPFIHRDFVDIAIAGVGLGLKIQITTNGGLVTRDKLQRLRGVDCLTVSVDALEETHDEIRGVKGAFARACQALVLAAEAGITRGTNTVIQRDNSHDLLGLFHHLLDVTHGRLDYVRHAPVEVTPSTADLVVPAAEIPLVREQLGAIAAECDRRGIWFSHRRQLLDHLELYVNKWQRRRPLGGCRIPGRFIGYSDLGFYLCWHQGHSIKTTGLVEALESDTARRVVAEGIESRCVGCNALTYSWDEEWNEGILAGHLASQGELSTQETVIHAPRASSPTLAGVNWPYLLGDYNHDLAPNERFPGWGCSFDPMVAFRHLAISRDLGFGAVRVWLCENGEGIVRDDRGLTAGVMPELLESVRVLQEGASLAGMRIYWSFLDGNSWQRNGDELTGRVARDADEAARFADRVVAPVANLFDPGLAFAVEVFNEPESLSKEVQGRGGIEWDVIVRAIRIVRARLHDLVPGVPVTSGCQAVFLPGLLADLSTGGAPPVDALDIHVYRNDGGLPYRTDLPVEIGDMPLLVGEAGSHEASGDSGLMETFLYNARSLEYSACFLWKLAGEDHLVLRERDGRLGRESFTRTARGDAVRRLLRDHWHDR